ncbi:hypothetical protein NPA11_01070 [Mycoplasma sp. 1578d]|uniref:hypothetical protein n=1 Tax=Mycoplasma sp. 1578d TaxID=2967299 RepID=UPI00211D0BA4|nr:hypothetical protein [Mycoplasma sp. 1578d]UUM20014.1 hypothetical protein NPA11_01070 [Mycoplasma sp. 1578d]
MKKKNIFKTLLATLAISTTSASAVSCLYESHPTVIYAKSYAYNNPFLNKPRIATKYGNKSLINFENSLFNKANLILFLDRVNYTFEGNYDISNKELEKIINNAVEIKNDQFIKNQKAITQITNTNALKYFNQQFDKLNQKLSEYQKGSNAKKLTDLLSLDFSITDKNKIKYTQEEKEIYKLYELLKDYRFIDISDPNKLVTEAKVREIIENYFKDTPFYSEYLKNKTLPLDDSRSMIKVEKNGEDIANISFSYVRSGLVPFNSIPYNRFIDFAKIIKPDFSARELTDSKDAYLKVFEYMKKQNYIVDDTAKRGMSLGFGPSFLLEGKNPEDDKPSDEFKVFSNQANIIALTPEAEKLRKEFLADPIKFFESHLELINYNSLVTILRRVQGRKNNIEKNKDPKLTARLQQFYNKDKNAAQLLQSQLDNFLAAYKKLKLDQAQNAPQSQINQEQAQVEELKKPFLKDIEKIRKIVQDGIEKARTNINHFVELYAYALFTLGDYKVQIIKGTHQYPKDTQPRDTYWLEFFDKKTNQWYMVDLYKGYLSYQKDSPFTYNPEQELFTNLPSGYTIDPSFKQIAHVK